jgi:hypothetical protein
MNGINLHSVVRAAITQIHPDEAVIIYRSSGQDNESGSVTPRYLPGYAARAQIQSENDEALYQSDMAGQNDITKRFYLYAESSASRPAGVVRPASRSGDLIKRASDNTWWLVVGVIDDFSGVGWTSARCTLQIEPPGFEPAIAEEASP